MQNKDGVEVIGVGGYGARAAGGGVGREGVGYMGKGES